MNNLEPSWLIQASVVRIHILFVSQESVDELISKAVADVGGGADGDANLLTANDVDVDTPTPAVPAPADVPELETAEKQPEAGETPAAQPEAASDENDKSDSAAVEKEPQSDEVAPLEEKSDAVAAPVVVTAAEEEPQGVVAMPDFSQITSEPMDVDVSASFSLDQFS
jgi:hypothetical protein